MLAGTAAVIRLKGPLSHCYFSTLSQTQKHTLGSASQTALAQKNFGDISSLFVHTLPVRAKKWHASSRARLNKSMNSSRLGQIDVKFSVILNAALCISCA